MRTNESVTADLLQGAIAGAAGTWVMTQVTTRMYARESEAAKKREEAARDGRTAYEEAAERASEALGSGLSDEQRSQAGTAIHWATGIAAGAVYAVVRTRWPRAAAARGLPFGAGFFMMADELLNPVLELTPGPLAFPWQTHARGLSGHLAFGLTTELVLKGLDRAVSHQRPDDVRPHLPRPGDARECARSIQKPSRKRANTAFRHVTAARQFWQRRRRRPEAVASLRCKSLLSELDY